jgi:hypothetical protein
MKNGIYIGSVANRIVNCTSYWNALNGFYISVGTNFIENCKAFYCGRCAIVNVSHYYYNFNQVAGGFYINALRAVTISNCSAQQNYYHGFVIIGRLHSCTNLQSIANNVAARNRSASVYLRCTQSVISGTIEVSAPSDWDSKDTFGLLIDDNFGNNNISITYNDMQGESIPYSIPQSSGGYVIWNGEKLT